MNINSLNTQFGADIRWTGNAAVDPEKITDFSDISNVARPANADKFVLELPVTETIYKKQEFVTDKRMAENMACCYSYMERTLTFADGSTFTSRSENSCFAINLDKSSRNFGSSGANMYDLSGGTEETWERIERSAEQTYLSGSISAEGFAAAYSAQSSVYRRVSASETEGTVSYKNGAIGKYTESAAASRELYNKCATFIAGAFGEDGSELALDEKIFNELFAPVEKSGKASADKLSQKLEKLEIQRKMLKDFMDRQLENAKKKDPLSDSLKAFADTYSKLSGYSYMNLTAAAEKIFVKL